jgi:hypothetical protein
VAQVQVQVEQAVDTIPAVVLAQAVDTIPAIAEITRVYSSIKMSIKKQKDYFKFVNNKIEITISYTPDNYAIVKIFKSITLSVIDRI